MSIETIGNDAFIEESISFVTPETDKIIALLTQEFGMQERECASVRSGLELVGYNYALILARYNQSLIEDGALEQFFKSHVEKVELHIPDPVRANLSSEVYKTILDEQAEKMNFLATEEVMEAPLIPIITVESLNPTPEEVKDHEIAGLKMTIEDLQAQVAALQQEVARLNPKSELLTNGASDANAERLPVIELRSRALGGIGIVAVQN